MGVDKVQGQINFIFRNFTYARVIPLVWMSDKKIGILWDIAESLRRLQEENTSLKERAEELEEQLEDSEGESDFFLSQSKEAYGAINEISSIIDRLNEDEE